MEVFQRFEHRTPHNQAGEPFVIGGHDVPVCFPAVGGADGVLVGTHVFVPKFALSDIIHRELPALPGVIEPGEEPPALLLLGDVQENLSMTMPLRARCRSKA